MIKLSRQEVKDLARIYFFSNTPYSLLREISKSMAVKRMKNECNYRILYSYYDDITSRAKRNEITMGLAYAVLVSLLTFERITESDFWLSVDINRLTWGPAIDEYIKKSSSSTQLIQVSEPYYKNRPKVYQDTGQDKSDLGSTLEENQVLWRSYNDSE